MVTGFSPRQVVAISLLPWDKEHDPEREKMDRLAVACVKDAFPEPVDNPVFGSGGLLGNDDTVVCRVTSVSDLAARLAHLPDGKLEALDLVGHGTMGELGIGNENRHDEAHILTARQETFAPLQILLKKFDYTKRHDNLFDDLPRLRLIGCEVGGYVPGRPYRTGDGQIQPGTRSGPGLLLTLSNYLGGIAVMATTGSIDGFVPSMQVIKRPDRAVGPDRAAGLTFSWLAARSGERVEIVEGEGIPGDHRSA